MYPWFECQEEQQKRKDFAISINTCSAIGIINSATKDFAEFQDYWLEQFSLQQAKAKQVRDSPSIYTYNEDILLHQELLFKAGESGSFLIAYLGVDGTYQHNRQHFVDFLSKNGL
ncbi:hypothetical protein [Thalassotalea sp. PS06]|uniref:hypothetical protein n=1 Tax=Thalassotalea sp. PS06 TaxID=2594005 RepID=UPI0011656B35|nr:hypothetical protein [Thalassotalea sp. PS06]QDP00894.1 hypothetical protein FNC98_05740 [Thalassotalea sp. PS06]